MNQTVICIDNDRNTYEVPVAELRWRPSAYGIVIKDNKVLLSRQFGKYDLPGGGVNLGEEVETAVIREVKEETGLEVERPKLIGLENSFFQAMYGENNSYHSLLIYFVCKYVGGELSTDGFDEHEKHYAEIAEWLPLGMLDTIELASTVDYRLYIKRAIEMQP